MFWLEISPLKTHKLIKKEVRNGEILLELYQVKRAEEKFTDNYQENKGSFLKS